MGTEEVSVEECCFKKGKRVLTDKDQEAVKECYKEYIGMVKIYYEEAKRSRHGEPGDVAVNCRGTAGKERPHADARIYAEVEEMLDGTPRKKSRTARDDVKMEGNKNKRRNSRNFCGGTTQREETRLEAFLQLHDFAQRDLSVADYTEEFDHLMLKCGIAEPEEQTIARYLRGLRKEIYDVVILQPFISYNDVYKLATEIEKRVKEKDGRKLAAYRISRGPNREHIEEEYQEFDSPPVFDEPLEQEDVIYGDTGELLVIRRALAADSTEDGVWLRNNIFHTRCTSHGKVCDVIIDSGSCENVVSETMVKKLSLKTEKHPRPYKLSWLQKGKSVHVDQRCLVHFSIRDKYRDKVLLLGRPWQFDRRTIHDGMRNTYSFDKDGGKIVLGPSKPLISPRTTEVEGNYFMSKCEFSKAFEISKVAYALVIKEVRNDDQPPPPDILIPLLKIFHP
ncbi:hypothetical protein Tco_1073643 [Tanacetum coccineum]